MKKIFIVVLLVVVLIAGVFILTGCGKNENLNEDQKSSTNSRTSINLDSTRYI